MRKELNKNDKTFIKRNNTKSGNNKNNSRIDIPLSAIVLVLIGGIFVLAAALNLIYNRLKLGQYHESCEKTPCLKNLNLNCINKICDCYDYQFWNNKKCLNKSTFNERCTDTNECESDKTLYCDTMKTKCLCEMTRYWDGSTCILKRNYNEECNTDKECIDSKFLICYNQTCQCDSTHFWSFSHNTCKDKLDEFELCTETSECKSPMNCSSGKCQCLGESNQFYDSAFNVCTGQRSYDQTCKEINEHQCRKDLNLICVSSVCKCNRFSHFWNGRKCVNYYKYNYQLCRADSECKNNLICKTSGSSCNCPSIVSNNKCDCPTPVIGAEYYWTGTECVIAASYNQPCLATYACKRLEEHTVCISGICSCGVNGFWKGNKCIYCSDGWFFHNNYCYRAGNKVSSIKYQSTNSSEIISACYNVSNSKLAKLYNSVSGVNLSYHMMNADDYYYIDSFKNKDSKYYSQDGEIKYKIGCKNDSSDSHNCVVAFKVETYVCLRNSLCTNSYKVLCEYPLI